MGSLSCRPDWVTCAGTLELDGSPGRWLAQRTSRLNASPLSSLSLARLSLLCFLSLFLLGGREELTTCLRTSLLTCTLVLGTGLQSLEREYISLERLELYQEELWIFLRGARARASLDWVTGLFLGTFALFLGTFVGIFLGTVSCFSGTTVWRWGTRGGWLWWGSCIHKRRFSCSGEVTETMQKPTFFFFLGGGGMQKE